LHCFFCIFSPCASLQILPRAFHDPFFSEFNRSLRRSYFESSLSMAAPRERSSILPREAESALQALALNWVDVIDAKKMEITPLTGGMTNEIFKCCWQTRDEGNPRKVLVRIYGDARANVFFDREYEIRAFECISRLGQGPRLLGSFPTGRIEEFLDARTLSPPDLKNPEISAKIAAKLWEFHHLDIPGPRQPNLWMRLRKWLGTALAVCPNVEVAGFRLECIEDEINYLEKMVSREGESVGFCHNDLQYANMMFQDEDKCLTIIDYDCSNYDPIAFDIANHFNEMAGNYHSDTPHILDYSKYPDYEERQRFVKEYLKSSRKMVRDGEVEKLLKHIEKYTLVSHVHWSLWSIISKHVNDMDFDYMDYAKQRFQRYRLLKPLLLNVESPYSSNGADWNCTRDFHNSTKSSELNANMHDACHFTKFQCNYE